MAQSFTEGHLTFDFPDAWQICRLSETSFHQHHFQSFCNVTKGDGGCKEVDFLAFDPNTSVLWFVEVKDYRVQQRTKPIELADEVALKVRDSLALLRVAPVRDNTQPTGGRTPAGVFARVSMSAAALRVVLHCELPANPSKLFPGVKDSANLQQKISTKLRQVDPHALIVDQTSNKVPWAVY